MSIRSIVTGSLFKAPELRTSKAGKPYLVATIKEGSGDAVRWVKAFVFSASAIEALRELSDGEPVSVAGEIEVELYQPANGDARISWKITVDGVLSARKPKKASAERKPAPASKPATSNSPMRESPPLDDDLPW